MVASIAAGIQFGWALQLSLLTPYVQLLGIPHTWAAFIWLCGPISGMLVQPIVGYHSDRCTSRFGRRRPFIAAGSFAVAVAVFLIGYAADLGHLSGDPIAKSPKPRAIAVFVVGFWILDVANNMLQGPCRALLADLSGSNQKKTRTANALYSFFMAVGNVLGFAAGAYTHLYKIFPFTKTKACDVYCANLKSCFFISIFLLLTLTVLALTYVREKQWSPEQGNAAAGDAEEEEDGPSESSPMPFFGEIFAALKNLQKPMWILLLVTCLNWIAWFPFLLFDTDWMGGRSTAEIQTEQPNRRFTTVRGGATVPLPPPGGVKAGALALFAVMGVPQAITYSIPFALASNFVTLLVLVKMLVSVASGPWDALFGGGNLPAFVVGAIAAAASGIFAFTLLPSPPPDVPSAKASRAVTAAFH
ncbi:hypothetical protein GH714_023619 [Hevea brasiliensis]|uniref:Uncharacterized protein n=1 Tax=Hevea brasiliensis TaxID=3981 RepID=A0A6A6LAX7_HEVBR|nr:hypothetical protein GH714_023619 [Hevea brasiliensis]